MKRQDGLAGSEFKCYSSCYSSIGVLGSFDGIRCRVESLRERTAVRHKPLE